MTTRSTQPAGTALLGSPGHELAHRCHFIGPAGIGGRGDTTADACSDAGSV